MEPAEPAPDGVIVPTISTREFAYRWSSSWLPPISRYELAAAAPVVPDTPAAPVVPAAPVLLPAVPLTLPAVPVDPEVPATPEPFVAFISMNPPGVTDADAEPVVPGAPLPMRHPVTVSACG
jgi:hypothetical protein